MVFFSSHVSTLFEALVIYTQKMSQLFSLINLQMMKTSLYIFFKIVLTS